MTRASVPAAWPGSLPAARGCTMRAMAVTAIDVAREFGARLAPLRHLHSAYLIYDPRGNRIRLSTLLDDFDEEVESSLARIELETEASYPEFEFDTIHLAGRDAREIVRDHIPENALHLSAVSA